MTNKERNHECEICHMMFGTITTLNKHKKEVHSKFKPFACEHCDKSFARKALIIDHMKAAHSEDRPFQCKQRDYIIFRIQIHFEKSRNVCTRYLVSF